LWIYRPNRQLSIINQLHNGYNIGYKKSRILGIGPSIKGASAPLAWFSEFFMISFFLPFLTDVEKGKKWSMISIFAVTLTIIITNLVVLFLYGSTTSDHTYPIMPAARYISIPPFFESQGALVIAIWVVGALIRISVFYYVMVLGSAQWLHLPNYKPIVFPLGFLIINFSLWDIPSFMNYAHFSSAMFKKH